MTTFISIDCASNASHAFVDKNEIVSLDYKYERGGYVHLRSGLSYTLSNYSEYIRVRNIIMKKATRK